MEKKILVTVGNNNRIVAFMPDLSIALDSTPIYNDAAVLDHAIREAFKDVMMSDQEFFLQIKNQELGGMYVKSPVTPRVCPVYDGGI